GAERRFHADRRVGVSPPRRPHARAGARSQPAQATRGPQERGVRQYAGATHRRPGRALMTWRMALPALAGVVLLAAADYQTEIAQWHSQREERLKSEGGWLSVAGLFWLHEGASPF